MLPKSLSEQRLSTKDQGARSNRYSDTNEHDYLFEPNPSQDTVNDKEISPVPFDQLLEIGTDQLDGSFNGSTDANTFSATPILKKDKYKFSNTALPDKKDLGGTQSERKP